MGQVLSKRFGMEEKDMFDVIVIGAGPAGSTAAKVLAERGKKVLLAERCRLPRYKSCSGVLIRKTMDLVETYFGEKVPPQALCTPVDNRGMIFTNDKGKEYRFEQEGQNVWRSSFDHWLAQNAQKCGAVLQDGVSVVKCLEEAGAVRVTLQGERTWTEEAEYVLDCEGITGAVKRGITGERQGHVTTFQTFNRGKIDLDPHYFYAYLQPELSEYDAWFNVKDDLLVLGVSVKNQEKISFYYKRFLSYMEERHGLKISEQLKAEKWLMPHIRPGCPITYARGRILFAGEIAGFLNPMGEGISAGMESAYHAANAIVQHKACPQDVLADYMERTKSLTGYMRRQWDLVAAMAEPFVEMKNVDGTERFKQGGDRHK